MTPDDANRLTQLAEQAKSALEEADVARSHCMWATLANAAVCWGVLAEVLPGHAMWATLTAWSWYASQAFVGQHEASKAAEALLREGKRWYP